VTVLALEVIREVDVPQSDRWFHRLGRAALRAAGEGTPVGAPSGVPGDPPPGTRRLEVTLLLTGDPGLRRLNRDYRGLDRPTDVLSFAQLEGAPLALAPGGTCALGDVAISFERAQRQATEYGHPLEREVGYLFVHGMLHLLGYDHEDEADREAMRAAEERALAAVGLSREAAAVP
jgi:probable rRNA maturation factor